MTGPLKSERRIRIANVRHWVSLVPSEPAKARTGEDHAVADDDNSDDHGGFARIGGDAAGDRSGIDPPETSRRLRRRGRMVHAGWQVLVTGDRIIAVGPGLSLPVNTRIVELAGDTLMPGMIEGHGHLFLHPYNEASWDDQVLHEPLALRTARAVENAKATLLAGFTSERDLGTEGAGYADVGLKAAIDQGIVPGPRLSVATRAIVALGAYGPKGFEPGVAIPQGAEEVSRVAQMMVAVRRQIAAGADWVKLYADYRWRPDDESCATLSLAD